MKKAFAYCRVSTEEQANTGKSIESQELMCRNWAREHDVRLLDVFIDGGKSGSSIASRTALKDMLVRVQDGEVDFVLVQDTDRLARNTNDHLSIKALLKKANTSLVSLSQPMLDDSPEGNLIDTIIASVNAFQSQITGRKTSKVLEQKAAMGWFPGGAPPLGYKIVENSESTSSLDRKKIVLDDTVAPFIVEIFHMYSNGCYSLIDIADYLNKKGIKSPLGAKIHKSLVARILKDDFYLGKFTWNKKTYIGKHPVLIDQYLFDKSWKTMEKKNQYSSRTRKHKFLLSGFLTCGLCGKSLTQDVHVKTSGIRYRLYFCSSCKKGTYVDCGIIEKQLEIKFSKVQISPEYTAHVLMVAKKLLEENRKNVDPEKTRFTNMKNRVNKAMRQLEDERFINHILSEDTFSRIYSRYESQLLEIDQNLKNLERDYSGNLEILSNILRLAENIGLAYTEADDHLKREYIALFFNKIEVLNGRISGVEYQNRIKPLLIEAKVRLDNMVLPEPKHSIQANIENNEQNRDTLQDGFDNILQAFENVSYMGELRQRWVEIKKLLKGGQPDEIPAAMHAQ